MTVDHNPANQAATEKGLLSLVGAILLRDLRQSWRQPSDVLNPIVFLLMGITLLPLGIGTSKALLAQIAPGMLWIMATLATLLSLDSLYRTDYQDGSLLQFQLSGQPMWAVVIAKSLAHWLSTCLPLTVLAPLMGVMLSLPGAGFVPLVVSLLLGTAILSLVGGLGAALTVCLKAGALVTTVIIIPLYLPVLILGANAISNAIAGFGYTTELALMGSGLALALIIMPSATAGALHISSSQ